MNSRIDELTTEISEELVQREAQTVRLQMSTKNGRRFVWMILNQSGMLQNPLHAEPILLGFNVGKQDMGRWLFDMVERYCPDLYPIMVKEAQQEKDYDDRQRDANDHSKPGDA